MKKKIIHCNIHHKGLSKFVAFVLYCCKPNLRHVARDALDFSLVQNSICKRRAEVFRFQCHLPPNGITHFKSLIGSELDRVWPDKRPATWELMHLECSQRRGTTQKASSQQIDVRIGGQPRHDRFLHFICRSLLLQPSISYRKITPRSKRSVYSAMERSATPYITNSFSPRSCFAPKQVLEQLSKRSNDLSNDL